LGNHSGVSRKVLGALTLWPVVYLLFCFAVVGIAAVQGDGDRDNADYWWVYMRSDEHSSNEQSSAAA
jgi:hypothetical protein